MTYFPVGSTYESDVFKIEGEHSTETIIHLPASASNEVSPAKKSPRKSTHNSERMGRENADLT